MDKSTWLEVICNLLVPGLQNALPRMCLMHLDMQLLEFKQLAEQAQNLSCQTAPWFKKTLAFKNYIASLNFILYACTIFSSKLLPMLVAIHMDQDIAGPMLLY